MVNNFKNATPINLESFKQKKALNALNNNKLNKILLSLSLFLFTGAITYSIHSLFNQPITTKSHASEEYVTDPKTKLIFRKILDNVPLNPNTVTATASANGETVTLISGNSYPYDEVVFTWEGAKAREPGTKIIGYYVYFGTRQNDIPFPESNHNKVMFIYNFVQNNSYTAKNLVKGQTYYLYVRTKTDSKIPNYDLGLEDLGNFHTLPAKKLFIYKHQ